MPSTEQVLASHEAALVAQDAVRVSMHYADDAVLIANGKTFRGPDGIAAMYAGLIQDLPDAEWRTDVAVIHDDLAYVEWSCRSAASKVEFGTDTFLVSGGRITRQTASFRVIAEK
jgi:ketosteroid isomerase-like protein